MSTADTVGIVAAAFLFLITSLVSVIVWIFLDFRKTIIRSVETNGRHLDAMMASVWGLTWKVDGVEGYLHDELGYRPVPPPVTFGNQSNP